MTSPEYEALVSLLDELEDKNLSDWESKFVSDLQSRLEEYGTRTNISEAQQAVLDRLERKYL